jgi:uncharacterized protein (DUF4415 family)
MKPNTSSPSSEDAAEFTPERLRRAKLRIGLKEVSREEWQAAVQEKMVKKQRVNIELDLDVLAWFKAQAAGPKYQELINAALREAMEKKRQEIA